MLGPVIGAFLFGSLHYEGTFLTFSVILMVCTVFEFILLPSRLNKEFEKIDLQEENSLELFIKALIMILSN